MLYADKKHLETETARDVLRVREKEMRYYARNLSMLATQSARYQRPLMLRSPNVH